MESTKNKLIAEFMGWELQDDPTNRWHNSYREPNGKLHRNTDTEPLLFHASWDWLMPVLKRINLRLNPSNYGEWRMINRPTEYNIEEVYAQAVKFIKEYNNG